MPPPELKCNEAFWPTFRWQSLIFWPYTLQKSQNPRSFVTHDWQQLHDSNPKTPCFLAWHTQIWSDKKLPKNTPFLQSHPHCWSPWWLHSALFLPCFGQVRPESVPATAYFLLQFEWKQPESPTQKVKFWVSFSIYLTSFRSHSP